MLSSSQESETGSWHVPIEEKSGDERARTWLCIGRTDLTKPPREPPVANGVAQDLSPSEASNGAGQRQPEEQAAPVTGKRKDRDWRRCHLWATEACRISATRLVLRPAIVVQDQGCSVSDIPDSLFVFYKHCKAHLTCVQLCTNLVQFLSRFFGKKSIDSKDSAIIHDHIVQQWEVKLVIPFIFRATFFPWQW